MASITTVCLSTLSRGEIKEIAKFLTGIFRKDPQTRWMLCNDDAMITDKFPKMVKLDLSVKGENAKNTFVTKMVVQSEGKKSKDLVGVAIWRKTMEHTVEKEEGEDNKGIKKDKNDDKRVGKNMLFFERYQLVCEKFHKVKFDIFPLLQYDNPLVYISWMGALEPEKQSKEIIREIFDKSKADEDELICMLGSNVQHEMDYQRLGFKTIHHIVLSDTEIENIDVIYDTIGGETENLGHQDVELFGMIREPNVPEIPFL